MRNVKKVIALVLVINMVMTNVMPSFAKGWSFFSFLFNENSKVEETELAESTEVDDTTKLVDELIEETKEIVEEENVEENIEEPVEVDIEETSVGANSVSPDEPDAIEEIETETTTEAEEPEEDETIITNETTVGANSVSPDEELEVDKAGSHPQEGSFGETHPYESEDETDAIDETEKETTTEAEEPEETTVELETLETIPNTVYSMLDEEAQGSGVFYLPNFWYNAQGINGAIEFLPVEEVTKITFQRGGEAPDTYDHRWYVFSSDDNITSDVNYWVWGYIVNDTEVIVHFDDRVSEIYGPGGMSLVDKLFSFGVKDKSTGEIKSELREINGIENINFRKLFKPSGLFRYNKKLESIDVSGFDMSQASDFSNMFEGCESLEELDLSSFNTSQAQNMSYMFSGCKNLKNIDLSSFNTSLCSNMEGMFKDLESIKTLDLKSFDVSRVSKMNEMFYNMPELTRIYANEKFNPTKATSCFKVFCGCPNLTGTYGYNDPDGGIYGFDYAILDNNSPYGKRGFLSSELETDTDTNTLTIVDYETGKEYTTIEKNKNIPIEISKVSNNIKKENSNLSDAYFFIWVDEDGNEYAEDDEFNIDKTQTIKLKYTRLRRYLILGLKGNAKFKDSAFKDGIIAYKDGYLYVEYDKKIRLPMGGNIDFDTTNYGWSRWYTGPDGTGDLVTYIEEDWKTEQIKIYAYMPSNIVDDGPIDVGKDEVLVSLYNLFGYYNSFVGRGDYKVVKKGSKIDTLDPGLNEHIGFEFKGWYEIDTTTSWDWGINRDKPFDLNTVIDKEIKLCAYWEEKVYPIRWHSEEVALTQVLYDNYSSKRYSEYISLDMSLRDEDLGHGIGDWWHVRVEDYDFVGFYKDKDFKVRIRELASDLEGPFDIYVKWKPLTATVEYRDKNKGTWKEEVKRGSTIKLPDMSDKEGFMHWYLVYSIDESGNKFESYEELPCKTGDRYTSFAAGKYVFKSVYKEDYDKLPYRVGYIKYETDYGTAPHNGNEVMVRLGEKIKNPGPPIGKVKGYKFSHWYRVLYDEDNMTKGAVESRLRAFDFNNAIADISFYDPDFERLTVFKAYWVESDEEETESETSPETAETTTPETTTPETTTKENPKETTKPAPQETTTQETTIKETTKETIIETSDIAPAETKETNPAPQETKETKETPQETTKPEFRPSPGIPCGGGNSGGGGGGGGGGGRGMSLPITSLENNKNQTQNQNQSDAKPASKNTFLFADNLSEWKYNTDDSWSMTVNINGQIVNATNGFYNIVKTENNVVTNFVYYFDEKGKMVTGWVKDSENNLYYFEPMKNESFGKMSIGWKEINGESFYFGLDGKMVKNSITPDGKYVGEDGKLISNGINIDAINQNNPFVRIV